MFEKKVNEVDKLKAANNKKQKKEKSSKGGSGRGLSIVKTVLIPFVIAGILVSLIYIAMQNKEAAAQLKTEVLCVNEAISANTFVESKDAEKYFTVTSVDMAAVPENAIKSIKDLPKDGFYVKHAMVKSQMVLSDGISESDAILDKYKNGYEKTSFSVPDFAEGVNGSLRKGDIVDLYAVDPATDALTLMAENVYVSEVYDNAGELVTTDEQVATAFTVYVAPEEVEQINTAICYEKIQMYQKTE